MTSTRSLPAVRRPGADRRPSVGFLLWLACVAGAVLLVALGARALAAVTAGAPVGAKIVRMSTSREGRP